MPIDFNAIIQNKLPGLVSRGFANSQKSFTQADKFADILKTLQPQAPEAPPPSSQLARAQTTALEAANPEEESGFNIFNALFGLLDIGGRSVRGLLGAGTSLAAGNTKEAGSRLLDAALSPLDAMTLNIFDIAKESENTTGSEILDDLGWKSGTTTEDERRIRIAMAGGMSRRDAARKFGIQGDKALSGEDAKSFETVLQAALKSNPELELNSTMDDLKQAVDAQDFGGFAVEVLTDPLTYISSGATASGKAAKSLGVIADAAPTLVKGVRSASKLDDALRVIKLSNEIGGKQKKRLSKQVTLAWKQVKEGEKPSLYLADNWAKQVREGQRAAVVGIGGKPLIRGGPVAEVLSHLGQTKTAEQILGKSTVSGLPGKVMALPGVNKVVGGVKGIVQFTRDKMDVKTGVSKLDSLITATDAESRKHLTEIGRVLNAFDQEIRQVAKGSKEIELGLRKQVSEAVELSKRTGGDFKEAAEAARVSLGLSNTLFQTETVAKIAAGVARINEQVLSRASQVPTRIRELNDDTIQYIHRMLSDEAKSFFRNLNKAKKFADDTGLEFNARSKTFNMRSDASRGKTLDELNTLFREKHGINLFTADPIASTRESVRLTQRAIANARFGARFVEEYGTGTDEAVAALVASVDELPERLLNMRKGAEIDAATSKAAARVARKEGREHIGEVAQNLRKTRASKFVDPADVPEGIDVYGIVNHFKKVLKDSGHAEEGTVSAFDIYNRLGLKLPDNTDDLAKLVSVRVPDEAAAFVTRSLKLQKDPTPFIKQYDRITQWLKATVTVPFPMFHGRNMLENMFKNTVEGNVNPRNYKNAAKLLSQASDLAAGSPDWVGRAANKLKAAFRKMGDPDKEALKDLAEAGVGKNYSEIADWMVAHGILDNRITSEFGDVLQDGAAGANKVARQVRGLGAKAFKELGTEGGAIRGGFALSAGTENLHRVSLFLHKIDRGYSALEAAAEVKRVFFDYRAMTNFETSYLKRMGFFYSFYRNNLRYIMQQFFTRPELTKQTLRLFQNDPDNPKQRWLSDKASFTVGSKEVSLGFIPQQQFNMFGFEGEDIWDKMTGKAADVAGLANPIISTPLEVAFNKDLFTGGPLLNETTSVDWSFAPESVQNIIGYRQTPDGRHKIGRIWNLVFGAVPVIGRFSSTAIQLTSKERTYWEKLSKTFSGIDIQNRDLEKDDLALIDRNLMRAQTSLPLVSKDGRGNYRVNTTTAQGRVASALLFPSKGKMQDLGLAPEILFQLKPYMTFDNEGGVKVTGILRLKMHELAVQIFPKEQAFFDGMEARSAVVKSVQSRNKNPLDEQAAEQFNAFLQGTR